jgi:hypothetical protein
MGWPTILRVDTKPGIRVRVIFSPLRTFEACHSLRNQLGYANLAPVVRDLRLLHNPKQISIVVFPTHTHHDTEFSFGQSPACSAVIRPRLQPLRVFRSKRRAGLFETVTELYARTQFIAGPTSG